MSSILFEIKENVAIIRLNRPEVFNSFNKEMAKSLQAKLDEFETDPNVRAIYIIGEGKAFCAGQDLQEVTDPNGPELTSIVRDHYNPIIERIRKIEKPIIGAVNGVAAGAGANIALACDICVATASSSFIQAFSKIGLIPDSGGTFFLPRLIGFQKASALMMLGDKIGAEEAERMGMIYKVFADEEFSEGSFKIASKLAKMPTKGLGLTKRALNLSMSADLTAQLKTEEDLQTEAGSTYDYNEGVAAFLEKRKPVFKGE
ncbi:MAG: enoyl-CoA hydratase-related protein [Crocinitomicaceae bacterium]|nr:enoyl-CoA hydratase-related protein [Crocinitomicaceae bacterium]